MDLTAAEIQQRLEMLYSSGETEQARPQAMTKIVAVTLLGSGFEADVFAFSLNDSEQTTSGIHDLILRLYMGQGIAEKAAHEFAAMRRLWGAGYPVPEVFVFRSQFPPFEQPFLIMERIQGASLGLSYWSGLETKRQEAQATLSQLMAALHALDASTLLPDSPLVHSHGPYNFIDHEISALSELLCQLKGREPSSFQDVLVWLAAHRSDVPCERLVVVHGDFHPNNILVRADGIPFVIDWSNVRLGDCRMDLAWSRLITQAQAQQDGGMRDLQLYEQLTGAKISGLEYFDVVACVRLLFSVLLSLEFGAASQGLRPKAEARTRQDTSHTLSVADLLHKRTGIQVSDFEERMSVLIGE